MRPLPALLFLRGIIGKGGMVVRPAAAKNKRLRRLRRFDFEKETGICPKGNLAVQNMKLNFQKSTDLCWLIEEIL